MFLIDQELIKAKIKLNSLPDENYAKHNLFIKRKKESREKKRS